MRLVGEPGLQRESRHGLLAEPRARAFQTAHQRVSVGARAGVRPELACELESGKTAHRLELR